MTEVKLFSAAYGGGLIDRNRQHLTVLLLWIPSGSAILVSVSRKPQGKNDHITPTTKQTTTTYNNYYNNSNGSKEQVSA